MILVKIKNVRFFCQCRISYTNMSSIEKEEEGGGGEKVGSCWIQFSITEGKENIEIFSRKYAKGTEIRGVHLDPPKNIDLHVTTYYMGKMTRYQYQKIADILSGSDGITDISNYFGENILGGTVGRLPFRQIESSVTLLELMSLGTGNDSMIGIKIECDIWNTFKNFIKESLPEICLICPSIRDIICHNETRTPHISLFAYNTNEERDEWLKKLSDDGSAPNEILTMTSPIFGPPVLVFKVPNSPLEKYIL